ncbi:ribosomal L1 domain-containing protein 1 [Pantherophis guttatus]|uniref:Ribosomal L1 domain-containing protein 1 n=1 Tax=Pantherophis guttatus TaxID=94885 RepID=A0A6P9CNN8_PANGU|nr:ribosomal L1 domain-containing protein 1 [Pantherophis guttatus]
MEAKVEAAVLPLNQGQIKKATHALLAYNANKQKSGEKVLLDVDQNIFLMITVWKIPPNEQVIKINLPHSILPDTSEVCLFTKDEPGLTAEQTENLYKKLLDQHGITSITEVISYKTFKTEYKPFEAKCRLLNRFALFLSDDRIRRLLPSQMGKHFYRRKKAPLCVDLKAKDLAKEIHKRLHGTILPVTNKGSCYMVRIGHSSMDASEITENVIAAAKAIAIKAPQIWKSVKVLHLKTSKSIALPVFHSAFQGEAAVQKTEGAENQQTVQIKKKKRKAKPKITAQSGTKDDTNGAPEADVPKTDVVEPPTLKSKGEEEIEEEIPQLVPIETQPSEKNDQVGKLKLGAKPELETGSPKLRSKRKAEIPVSQPETPTEASALEKSNRQTPGRKCKMAKQEVSEKTQSKDAKQPLAKPTVAPKRLKAPKSDTKPPKRDLRRMKVQLSL